MKKEKTIKLFIIFVTICLLTIPSVQGFQENDFKTKVTKENKDVKAGLNEHFTDSIIMVFGKCDRVDGPLIWLLGFYCPILKRNFRIIADGGENESLNAIVIGPGSFGSYFDLQNVWIDIRGARGALYYFGKSILADGNNIIAFCKAKNIFLNSI